MKRGAVSSFKVPTIHCLWCAQFLQKRQKSSRCSFIPRWPIAMCNAMYMFLAARFISDNFEINRSWQPVIYMKLLSSFTLTTSISPDLAASSNCFSTSEPVEGGSSERKHPELEHCKQNSYTFPEVNPEKVWCCVILTCDCLLFKGNSAYPVEFFEQVQRPLQQQCALEMISKQCLLHVQAEYDKLKSVQLLQSDVMLSLLMHPTHWPVLENIY